MCGEIAERANSKSHPHRRQVMKCGAQLPSLRRASIIALCFVPSVRDLSRLGNISTGQDGSLQSLEYNTFQACSHIAWLGSSVMSCMLRVERAMI
jgi:hypothetical protein